MNKSSPAKQLPSSDFENSEQLRRRCALRKLVLESAPQPQSQPRPIYRNQSTQTTEIVAEDVVKPQELVRCQKTPCKKVDKVVSYLQKMYRWSVPTFMENYITAKYSFKSNSKTHKKCAKKLLVAIFSNLVIKKALFLVKIPKLLKL